MGCRKNVFSASTARKAEFRQHDEQQFTPSSRFFPNGTRRPFPSALSGESEGSFAMSRAYDISDFAAFLRKYGDSGRDSAGRTEEPSRVVSQRTRPDRGRNQESTPSRNGYDRSRTIYRSRNREYSLRESEVQTLTDLGKFRMVPADDLARFAYRGDRSQMESDLRNLSRQGLIEQRSIEGHSSYSTNVLTLTKDGHRLLERAQLVSHRQTIYHGLVKHKEARHDADLYRLYHKVAREISD